jgi:uncharacterized protein YbjT (DUF2867 family)
MYVITGATGNTGKPITMALLKAGKKVRIISRSAEKAKELTEMGAELFIGESSNVDVLKKAFEGATAVYALIAMDFAAEDMTAYQQKQANAIAEALKAAKVKYVVSLSSQGAHLAKDSGVVLGLNKMENLFNQIDGLNCLHLRPSYFMENSMGMIGMIKQSGILGSPVNSKMTFPIIATKDIAEYATKRLLALDFTGHNTQDLLGKKDVSYIEIAKVYGEAIGKPELQYVEVSYDDFKNALVNQMGASVSVADNYNVFIKAFNDGKITETAKRNAESTTPTGIEDFAATFAYVYNM